MAGQLQPATATAGVPSCIKMIKQPALIAAGILQLWNHTMRNTFNAAIQ